jgi:hypothetical protein
MARWGAFGGAVWDLNGGDLVVVSAVIRGVGK